MSKQFTATKGQYISKFFQSFNKNIKTWSKKQTLTQQPPGQTGEVKLMDFIWHLKENLPLLIASSTNARISKR